MHIEVLLHALLRNIELQEKILLKLDVLCDQKQTPTPDPTIPNDLMDYADIQSRLKISESTLYRWKKAKLINVQRIGKKDYFSLIEILKHTAQNHNPKI